MGKQQRNRRTQVNSGVGLLFVSKERYLERVWDATRAQALADGKTDEQANKAADKALRQAKGEE